MQTIDLLPNIPEGAIVEPKYCDPIFNQLSGINDFDIKTKPLYRSNFLNLLLNLCNLYRYENLPIPQIELEIRLIMQGHATIFHTERYGWVTGWGSLYGISIYNHFTNWIVTQPILGENSGVINENGFVIYNTQLDKSGGSVVLNRLRYYAKLLTDLQVSLDMYAINTRAISTVIARDDVTKNALEDYYKRLKDGDLSVPLAANGVLPTHSDLLKTDKEYFRPNDILNCIDHINMQFSEEFGILKLQEKPERMVSDEVQADATYLAWNASAMALSRAEGLAEFNTATNSNVKLNFIGGIK